MIRINTKIESVVDGHNKLVLCNKLIFIALYFLLSELAKKPCKEVFKETEPLPWNYQMKRYNSASSLSTSKALSKPKEDVVLPLYKDIRRVAIKMHNQKRINILMRNFFAEIQSW